MATVGITCKNPSRIPPELYKEGREQYKVSVRLKDMVLVLAGDTDNPTLRHYRVRCPLCGLVEIEDINQETADKLMMLNVKIDHIQPSVDVAPHAPSQPLSYAEIDAFSQEADSIEARIREEFDR